MNAAQVRAALANWKVACSRVTRQAATWLFVLSFLTLGVGRDHAYGEWAGLALLALASFVFARQPVPVRAVRRSVLSAAVFTLIVCAYFIFGSWPISFGSTRSYDLQAFYFAVTFFTVCLFAMIFFEERLFGRVIWCAATVTLWVGVLSYLLTRLSHHPLLVSHSHGVLRMQGTLSEPSAWASVIPLVLLLAVRRRSWLHLGLAVIGTVLAASPTCLLVLAVTLPLYYALTGTGWQRVVVVLTLGVFLVAGVFFVRTAQPRPYLTSHNSAENAVGRLLAGIENIETDGRQGHNTRFGSTRLVISDVKANGWLLTGAGPAADRTYFPAKYPSAVPLLPDALWVSFLFDFGLVGLALLAVLMLTAVWRMRRRPQMCAILLPFFVTSLVNSAEGYFEYQFVALGVILFSFGRAGATQLGVPPVAMTPRREAVLEGGEPRT